MRLLLVDDDAFNRDGMRRYLSSVGYEVTEASDAQSAWRIVESCSLSVAVVDLAIPVCAGQRADHHCGSDLVWRIKYSHPKIGVVVFSAYEDHGEEFANKVREGVRGIAYLLKGCRPQRLEHAIREVAVGKSVFDHEIRTKTYLSPSRVQEGLSIEERPYIEYAAMQIGTLTCRLRQVAELLSDSYTVEGVAEVLQVSRKTAENYVGQVYDRLGLTEMGHEAPRLRKATILVKAFLLSNSK